MKPFTILLILAVASFWLGRVSDPVKPPTSERYGELKQHYWQVLGALDRALEEAGENGQSLFCPKSTAAPMVLISKGKSLESQGLVPKENQHGE